MADASAKKAKRVRGKTAKISVPPDEPDGAKKTAEVGCAAKPSAEARLDSDFQSRGFAEFLARIKCARARACDFADALGADEASVAILWETVFDFLVRNCSAMDLEDIAAVSQIAQRLSSARVHALSHRNGDASGSLSTESDGSVCGLGEDVIKRIEQKLNLL